MLISLLPKVSIPQSVCQEKISLLIDAQTELVSTYSRDSECFNSKLLNFEIPTLNNPEPPTQDSGTLIELFVLCKSSWIQV